MEIHLEFAFEANVSVSETIFIGDTPVGKQFMIPITGGTFEGPELNAKVLPVGADFLLERKDGVAEVKATYSIETDDDQKIYIDNWGYFSPPKEGRETDEAEYFRTVPTFRAPEGKYSWLNHTIMVCSGEKGQSPSTIRLKFYKVK